MDENFREFQKQNFELFRILLCSKKITKKTLEIFGINWEILELFQNLSIWSKLAWNQTA